MRAWQVDREHGSTVSQLDGRSLTPAARAVDLTKAYGRGDAVVRALDGVNVEFERGSFPAVMGPSGSGKSTLMHCVAGLDVPTSGRAFVRGQETGRLDDGGVGSVAGCDRAWSIEDRGAQTVSLLRGGSPSVS